LASALFALGLAAGAAIGWLVLGRLDSPAAAAMPAAASPGQPPSVGSPTGHPAEVLRVIDGDTFEARVHVWPGLAITTRVRLRGIDAPEMRARCPEEQSRAQAARDALDAMLAGGDVRISAVALDKYGGRVVADAATRGAPDISQALLAAGLARPYAGGRRKGWCGNGS
jgi:endonuclease YncB( thermonuclease family)